MKLEPNRHVIRAAITFTLALSLAAAAAQAADRPRIGLALSGGGARGAAHVGVLKVLEELRVPVDCITGTSMGSIVGGSFAAGMTPREMEKVINETDWEQVFTDRPPRSEISMRRKEDDYKILWAPEFGLDKRGFQLPKGVVAGVSIENMMRRLAAPAYGISDFSKLPIPFKTVATDIETGEAVVLDHGSLAKAMRASMSVPGAVAPVEIDGHLLVDGGLADNLPIELVRKTCADVVIAVNIQSPLLKRDDLNSLLGVTGQLINLLGKDSVDRQLKTLTERDVYIKPELGSITSGSFDRTPEAVRIGEEAARALADSLRRYSIPATEYTALRQTQIAVARAPGAADEIRVTGLNRTNPEVVRETMETRPGDPLNQDKVAEDTRRIYGRGDYESVDYQLLREPGRQVLLIEPLEKSWGPNYLRFGLGLRSQWDGDSDFNLLAQYRMTALNKFGAEWLTELQIGQQDRLFTEFYQPLSEAGHWFVAPFLRYSSDIENVYQGDDKIAEYDVKEWRVGVDVGAVLGTYGELRVGPRWRDVRAERSTGSTVLPDFKDNRPELHALLKLDQLDHVNFPRAGYRVVVEGQASFDSLGADENSELLTGEFASAHSFGPHTINLRVLGASTFEDSATIGNLVSLGGPRRVSGLNADQLRGTDLAYASVSYYRQLVELPSLLGSGLYGGGSLEAGNVWHRIDGSKADTVLSAGPFIGADTFLGPIYVLWSFTDKGQSALWLTIGQR